MEQTWNDDYQYFGSQNLETEYGVMTLQEIGQSDRGTHRFSTLPIHGTHEKFVNLIPHYFFGEEVAKFEIRLWLETIKKLCIKEQTKSIALQVSFKAEYLLHAKYCMLTRGKSYIDGNFLGYYFNITTTKELDKFVLIDGGDVIPRLFMDEDSAYHNAEAWIMRNRQQAKFSSWLELINNV